MARFKVLKGVAHNVGSSFTSLMNYTHDDYYLGYLLRFARETGEETLEIDLLAGEGSPESLLRDPITRLPEFYSQMFRRLVRSAGSDEKLVQFAKLTLAYDLRRSRPNFSSGEFESHYTCDVGIVDVRGKSYTAQFSGWWAIGNFGTPATRDQTSRNWWNPVTWFR